MNKYEAKKLSQGLSALVVDKIKEEGEFQMSVFVVSGDKTRVLSGFDPNSYDQKLMVAELTRRLVKKLKAEAVVICTESFTVMAEKTNPEESKKLLASVDEHRQKYGTLEGHPLCREAVFVSMDYKTGLFMDIFPFSRDEDGNVVNVEEGRSHGSGTAMDGILTNLMDTDRPSQTPAFILDSMLERLPIPVIPTSSLGAFVAGSPSYSKH